MKVFIRFTCAVVLLSACAVAQMKVRSLPPNDGAKLYAAYCASCHGTDLTGNTATNLAARSNMNLTRIATSQDEIALHVRTKIANGTELRDHPVTMPSWKAVLRNAYHGDETRAAMAIANLTDYVVSRAKK